MSDEIRPGEAFPSARFALSAERQRTLHACCDISPERWGSSADPGLLAHEPFRLMGRRVAAGRPGWGYVGMGHRIRMTAPIPLDEALDMTGVVTDVEPVARGTVLRGAFCFSGQGGDRRLVIEPRALMLDPASGEPRRRTAGPGDSAGFERLMLKALTPEKVRRYCADSENLAHTDPAHARRLGFRAPIVAGNQLVNFHLDALVQTLGQPPEALDVEIRFLRPVMWDETVGVDVQRDVNRRVAAVRICGADATIASLCIVHGLE